MWSVFSHKMKSTPSWVAVAAAARPVQPAPTMSTSHSCVAAISLISGASPSHERASAGASSAAAWALAGWGAQPDIPAIAIAPKPMAPARNPRRETFTPFSMF